MGCRAGRDDTGRGCRGSGALIPPADRLERDAHLEEQLGRMAGPAPVSPETSRVARQARLLLKESTFRELVEFLREISQPTLHPGRKGLPFHGTASEMAVYRMGAADLWRHVEELAALEDGDMT